MRFFATLDTVIYEVPYTQGDEVDTTGWARPQLLQFLSLGLMAPFSDNDSLFPGYNHIQSTASASWTVEHNLGRYPAVDVYVDNELVLADVFYIDANNLSIVFPEETSGVAALR